MRLFRFNDLVGVVSQHWEPGPRRGVAQCEYLEECAFKVDAASTDAEALNEPRAVQGGVDAMVMDIGLPSARVTAWSANCDRSFAADHHSKWPGHSQCAGVQRGSSLAIIDKDKAYTCIRSKLLEALL